MAPVFSTALGENMNLCHNILWYAKKMVGFSAIF